MFRVFALFTGRFTYTTPTPPAPGLLQMNFTLNRIGD